ncbi:3-methyl-2-oxobutanoate hydroxymethyltransferase [Mangrovimonas yunxiaonensis]|uniref:3-methyl-2-oxobutanoate hydroxymethyltransferase n=1 Tax=Mangrovimonas yunxiaonensis TaxID=1197477 RepID=A0A084TJX8_9FLAO|nr:nuclear transport factor 2 family protein [Mangrovimonas yunxiaonensis]KFB01014.1 3-methyl-2-oxobutanoate hydroxymethyltransferase [Mangrovimonas yunxiaonensis]
MVRIIRFLALLMVTTVIGQTNPEIEVKQAIDTFFEGFHKGDTTLMKSVLADKILLQTAFKNKAGQDQLATDDLTKLLAAIGGRPETQKWEEKLLDYTIKVDGNMANAWIPYEFWLNDNFSHCGVNSFQLFNNNGAWQIIYLIDTRKRLGCLED